MTDVPGFETRWCAFVQQWSQAANAAGRAALVDRVLEEGLAAVVPVGTAAPGVADDETRLACEVALVRRAGVVDVKRYRRANAEVRARKLDEVEHFCRTGWRGLHNPSLDFDLWWYWSEHLDPRSDSVNPVVHHLVQGRFEGAEPVPPREPVKPAADLSGARARRICLFAGYDADGEIDATVVSYLSELSRFADVFYLADGFIAPEELAKLDGIAEGAWCLPHGAYDFGSYSILARDLVGWERIDEYDELLLANDSGFLVRPLDEVFAEMESRPCDWWGLQMTRHDFDRDSNDGSPLPIADVKDEMIGQRFMSELDHLHISSYFLAFRRPVLQDEGFRRRLSSVVPQAEKVLVIYKYEIGLSRYLMCRGFDFSTLIDDLYPFHPLYTDDYFRLLDRGFPLLKRNFLSENSRGIPDLVDWRSRVGAIVPEADLELVELNLQRVAAADALHRSFSIVTGPDGTVTHHKLLVGREVMDEDAVTPTFAHWWAFPVCPREHVLTAGSRAVFEAVRHDPTIKKVVLTRSRTVDLDGENVVLVPLRSAEGQRLLVRSGLVLVQSDPRSDVQFPISSERHAFVHVGGHTFAASAATSEEWVGGAGAPLRQTCDAVVSPAGLGHLTTRAAVGADARVWATGLPAADVLLAGSDALPADLRAQEDELRDALGGRALVLLDVAFDRATGYAGLDEEAVDRLGAWCAERDAVIGYRDDPADHARRLAQLLHRLGPSSLRLSLRRFPIAEVHQRVATAMVSGFTDRAATFLALGRPVVALVRDGEEEALAYAPSRIWPDPVCRDWGAVPDALTAVLDEPRDRAWAARLMVGELVPGSAERLARRARALMVERADRHPFPRE